MDYRIKEILAKVERDISQPLTIKDLAASVNVSVSRFQHLFKQETKTGIIKYINNRRLEEARRLLETTHLRVKEIRLRVGLRNESHFMRRFKEKFGETPCNYRKTYQKSGNGQQIAETDSKKLLLFKSGVV